MAVEIPVEMAGEIVVDTSRDNCRNDDRHHSKGAIEMVAEAAIETLVEMTEI